MAVLSALVLASLGATQVWTEPAGVRVYADSRPVGRAEASVRLYAAGGEYESFQICIAGSRQGWQDVTVESHGFPDAFPAPAMYLVAYVEAPSPQGVTGLWPDPLVPFESFDVPPGETRALWVTFHIPPDTPPGLYRGEVVLRPSRAPSRSVAVTLEVFGFNVSAEASLPIWSSLDRALLRGVYGIRSESIEDWAPIYEAIAGYPFGFGPWSAPDLVRVRANEPADTGALKEHLAWLLEHAPGRIVDIGAKRNGIAPFPAPRHSAEQDPLQLYLFDMAAWLRERGALDRTVFEVSTLPPGDVWQETRAAYFRTRRADRRIPLALEAPLHPYFERYVDIWVVPFDRYQPAAHRQLKEGGSLAVEVAYPAHTVLATSTGAPPGPNAVASRAEDAYDGSLFTAWWSGAVPSSRQPQRIELHFVEPVITNAFRIGWRPGGEPTEVIVRTAFDGRVFSRSSVDWTLRRGVHAYDESWSEGRFKTTKRFLAIELEFRGTEQGGPVAVSEIEFGPPRGALEDQPDPPQVWLRPPSEGFASLAVGAAPIEARLWPWICWGHGADGLRIGDLVDWPRAWRTSPHQPTGRWVHTAPVETLFYPGEDSLLPSIRAMVLRDGFEDYAYLTLAANYLRSTGDAPPEPVELALRPRLYAADMRPDVSASYAEQVPGWRVALGRFLGGADWTEDMAE